VVHFPPSEVPVTIEIRSCRDKGELEQYGQVVAYVFAEENFENVASEVAYTLPEWTTCGFDGDRCVATMGTLPFTVRLNGAAVRMGGVTAVGTLPEVRRQGILRKIMTRGFEEMRDREQAFAILWASMGAIYQRFGYGLASSSVNYSFDPRFGGFETNIETTGSVTMMPKEDAYPIIKQLFIQYATPRNLMIHRSTTLWNADILRPSKKGQPLYIAVYRNADGEPRGHVVYETKHSERDGPGPNQVLTVKDLIHLDMEAYRALWEYVRRHDLAGTIEMSNVGEDEPAPDLLLEPRMLRKRVSDAIWMRVVDIARAIPARPYGTRAELTFRVPDDRMTPWNDGAWLMETDGTTTEVRRTDRSPDLEMPVNTLASLIAGHRSATHCSRVGKLSATSARALETADAIFKTDYPPHCPNNF
jgi:predicted acetyltransferase